MSGSRCCHSHPRRCLPVIDKMIPHRIHNNTLHPWSANIYLSWQYSTFFRADFKIPEVSYCDYVWDNLAEHAHLPGLVCGVTGQTVLHGEVGALDMECSPR